jgi:hypothetical protein
VQYGSGIVVVMSGDWSIRRARDQLDVDESSEAVRRRVEHGVNWIEVMER